LHNKVKRSSYYENKLKINEFQADKKRLLNREVSTIKFTECCSAF
jgi:hypothetical protein